MAATEPGQVSPVVETEAGFHIFLRQELPAPETLSAKHIVIGHARAPWLALAERQEHAQTWRVRDMEEARVLANRLADELRGNPDRFDALVREHSDHWDAEQEGDVGSWSTLESGPYAQALALVAEVPVEEIVGPVQTFYGYSVWKRTASIPRGEYATQALRFNYNPEAAPDSSASRGGVERQVQRILADLATTPALFPSLFEQYGEEPQRWTEGRGRRGMEHLVAKTEIGAFAETTVDVENAFFVIRRVAPTAVPLPPPPLARLPAPTQIALGYYFAKLNDAGRRELLSRSVRACGLSELDRFPAVEEELAALNRKLAERTFSVHRQERAQAFLKKLEIAVVPQSGCALRELAARVQDVFVDPRALKQRLRLSSSSRADGTQKSK